MLPADVHLSVHHMRPMASTLAAISTPALQLNLSPAAIACLLAVAQALEAAATTRTQAAAQPAAVEYDLPAEEEGVAHKQPHSIQTAAQAAAVEPDLAAEAGVVGEQHVDARYGKQRDVAQPDSSGSSAAEQAEDDLRCGLFSMTPALTYHPGVLSAACYRLCA